MTVIVWFSCQDNTRKVPEVTVISHCMTYESTLGKPLNNTYYNVPYSQ